MWLLNRRYGKRRWIVGNKINKKKNSNLMGILIMLIVRKIKKKNKINVKKETKIAITNR